MKTKVKKEQNKFPYKKTRGKTKRYSINYERIKNE